MESNSDAAGPSSGREVVGRVDMEAGSERGFDDEPGLSGESTGAWLLAIVLVVLVMVVALVLIFHNALRIG